MRRALDLDSSPALGVPLRFFVGAPFFVVAAAALLLWAGPDAFVSRWSPFALALTHLFTLGALGSTMVGALIQILPVVTGVRVAGGRATATVVHALLTAGTIALASAFLCSFPALYAASAALLAPAFAWFIAACAIGLWRQPAAPSSADILRATRLALLASGITAIIGTLLASAIATPFALPFASFTDVHATWGLAGWIGLLIAGIGYQVIPMFQATEPYPRTFARHFAPLTFAMLAISTAVSLGPEDLAATARLISGALLLIGYSIFAAVTLRLLWTRKRPSPDATTLFWYTSMTSLALCLPLAIAATAIDRPAFHVTLGVLVLAGVAWSAVNGMLYKIIPFLLWYHLQATLPIRHSAVPKVKEIIADRIAVRQFKLHLCALVVLLAASQWPHYFARIAGITLGASAISLIVNLGAALLRYAEVKRELASFDTSRLQAR